MYSHKAVQAGHILDNGTRTTMVLRTMCGDNVFEWSKHPQFAEALDLAHVVVYGKDAPRIPKTGLELQQSFRAQLLNLPTISLQQSNRTGSYRRAANELYATGLISQADHANFMLTL